MMRKLVLLLSLAVTSYAVWAQQALRPGVQYERLTMADRAPVRGEGPEAELPSSLNNSKSPYFPAIINQYGGSCAQASGIHYLFTYEVNRMLERPVQNKASNTFSYRWIWNMLNGGKDEGSFSSDGIDLTMVAGCMTVADFGDENASDFRWPTGYNKYYNAMHYKTGKYMAADLSTMEGINTFREYLYDKHDGHPGGGIGVFSISPLTDDYGWGYTTYSGPSETGIEEIITLKSGNMGAHAMTLVGYDMAVEYDCDGDGVISDEEKGAFILVNSWGTGWGTDGMAYIPFKYFLDSGQEKSMTLWDAQALCIETVYCEPTLTMKLQLRYSSRNDLHFRFGMMDGIQESKPVSESKMTYPIMNAQGGDHNMQGSRFASGEQIEVGFDLSSIRHCAEGMKAPCYMLIVGKSTIGKSGSGRVFEATVTDYETGEQYTTVFPDESNSLTVGSNVFMIPSKTWFKNGSGVWYEPVQTSSNVFMQSDGPVYEADWTRPFAIRKANGGYAKIKVKSFDSQSGKMTLEILQYE